MMRLVLEVEDDHKVTVAPYGKVVLPGKHLGRVKISVTNVKRVHEADWRPVDLEDEDVIAPGDEYWNVNEGHRTWEEVPDGWHGRMVTDFCYERIGIRVPVRRCC